LPEGHISSLPIYRIEAEEKAASRSFSTKIPDWKDTLLVVQEKSVAPKQF
jgi:hypothetical protein